jgi:hypothetical protein
MHIHKPTPARNLREFFSEISIIVVGILIAIALEQVVEAVRDHRRVEDARSNIHAEIANNLGLMERRAQTEPCVSRRLDEVAGLIAEASAGHPAQGPLWIGHPMVWITADGRYRSGVQSGAVGLMPTREQAVYSSVYAMFAEYTATQRDEESAWSDLRTLELQPAPTAQSAPQLQNALEHARMARWSLETFMVSALRTSKQLNIAPGPFAPFKQESICIPLHTPRDEALKLVIQGRPGQLVYDEP